MDFLEEIWRTLRSNTSRSLMTGFGVFWGILMLLVLVGIGNAFIAKMKGIMGNMPANTCAFFGGQTSKPYAGLQAGREWHITMSDVEAIATEIEEAEVAVPVNWASSADKAVRYGKNAKTYGLEGTIPEYVMLFGGKMSEGRFLNAIDLQNQRKVCVIGSKVRDQLLPADEPAVGKMIFINNVQFRVVGVLAKSTSEFDNDDENIVMPLSTLQRMFNLGDKVYRMFVVGREGIDGEQIEKKVGALLRQRHRVAPDDERAVWSWNMGKMIEGFNMVFIGLNALLWLIGLGTLISGAVGVSNIMLITVRERTKEIGIRRAIGATPWIILRQIMAESLVLTGTSGVMGICAAVGALYAVSLYPISMGDFLGKLEDVQVSFSVAIAALIVIIVVGMLAGLLPALRALAIKPVEALSEE